MRIFKIATAEYVNDISGTGAKLYGGRWNHKGSSMLYCSENVSLTILELFVHFDGLTVPDNLELLELNLEEEHVKDFPILKFNKMRLSKDSEYAFKKEGEKWLNSKESLALRVPSIITSLEYNILINPAHSKFNLLVKCGSQKLNLDKRLFK